VKYKKISSVLRLLSSNLGDFFRFDWDKLDNAFVPLKYNLDPLHLTPSHSRFGHITHVRPVIILEQREATSGRVDLFR